MLTDIGMNMTIPAGVGTPEAGLPRIMPVISATIRLYAGAYCRNANVNRQFPAGIAMYCFPSTS